MSYTDDINDDLIKRLALTTPHSYSDMKKAFDGSIDRLIVYIKTANGLAIDILSAKYTLDKQVARDGGIEL